MKRIETELPGVCIIEPEVFEDPRGYFFETYHSEKFAALRIDAAFVQENQSLTRRGVLRGLHYQLAHPQAKLCRVVAGEVFDVAVDIRVGSETFGRWTGVVLSSINRRQIFIAIARDCLDTTCGISQTRSVPSTTSFARPRTPETQSSGRGAPTQRDISLKSEAPR